MTKTSRAFVLEPCSRLDVSPASKFGEIEYIFQKNDGRPSIWTEEFAQAAMKKLKACGYDPAIDFIIIAGRIIPMIKLIAALAAEYQNVRVLFHDAIERDYVHQTIGHSESESL